MIQILLYLWALVLSAYSVSLLLTSNFNMGNLMVWVITAASWVTAIWHRGLYAWVRDTLAGRTALLLCLAAVLVLAGVLTFISVKAYSNPPTGQEKIVVVLGAGLRKDRPSKLLRYRLDKAYEYAVAHPDTILVTAGGQGRDEWVPEGQAMRDYLIEKGLPPDRVLAETRSTSTEENFAFAKQVLEQSGFDPDAVSDAGALGLTPMPSTAIAPGNMPGWPGLRRHTPCRPGSRCRAYRPAICGRPWLSCTTGCSAPPAADSCRAWWGC